MAGGGASYTIEGADVVLRATQNLSKDIRGMVNRELRAASKQIATQMAARIAAGEFAAGAPQARAVASTARAKSDRLPVVKIPSRKVPLSGNKRGAGRAADRAIAWGATGGGTYRFPGTTRWTTNVHGPGAELAAQKWWEAARSIAARYGLGVG